ncbi:MAG: hypothetical protein ABSF99_05375 [Anaerolineales bacterium]
MAARPRLYGQLLLLAFRLKPEGASNLHSLRSSRRLAYEQSAGKAALEETSQVGPKRLLKKEGVW